MIHVIFDTSGIGQNKNVRDSNYAALKNLVESKKISIHIPYIVKMEVETQETEFYYNHHNHLKKSIKKFDALVKSDDLNKSINYLKIQVDELEQKIKDDYSRFSNAWITGLNAKVYDITLDQAKRAWDSYFKGTPPLKAAKFRPDIPDSFICRSIEDIIESINNNSSKIFLIANDNKVIDTFNKVEKIIIYKNIIDFIKSNEIQQAITESDIKVNHNFIGFTSSLIKNLNNFGFLNNLKLIEINENKNKIIYQYLNNNLPDVLEYEKFEGMPLSNEFNGEATILACEDINTIDIDFANAIYFGLDHFGLPFTAEVVVNVGYFIDKMNFYDVYIDEELKYSDITTEDWNKHLLRAERLITIMVTGLFSIELDLTNIHHSNKKTTELSDYTLKFNNSINNAVMNIDYISNISIKE